MLRRTIVLSVIILVGHAVGDPVLPAGVTVAAAPSARSSVTVIAPLQTLTIQSDSGTGRVWFSAHIVGDSEAGGGAAQMDGAILVVSAADGPMPQIGRGTQTLRIDIERGSVDSGLVRFEGTATLEEDNRRNTFPITGSVGPIADKPDYIVWDIVGGNVHYIVESRGWLFLK